MSILTGMTTGVIEAAPLEVFAKLTNLSGLPSWNVAMTKVWELPENLEPGAEWVVECHVLGRSWRSRSRCEVFDPDAGPFAYRSGTDDGNPSYARWEWTVTPAGDATAVEVRWELHPVTFWRRVLLGRIRARQLAKAEVPTSLGALRQAVRQVPAPG